MTDALRIAAIWSHILGIALFVGPQFFLAFAWVPASRQIGDMATRVQAMRTLTQRFAWIAAAGLGLLVAAGSYLIATWRTYYAIPDESGFLDRPYGVLFTVKMALFAALLVITAIHTFRVGPRLVDAIEAESRGQATAAALRRARTVSTAYSAGGLLLALAIMVLGAMMNTARYSIPEF